MRCVESWLLGQPAAGVCVVSVRVLGGQQHLVSLTKTACGLAFTAVSVPSVELGGVEETLACATMN